MKGSQPQQRDIDQHRRSDHGCRIRGLGQYRSTKARSRCQLKRSRCYRRRSACSVFVSGCRWSFAGSGSSSGRRSSSPHTPSPLNVALRTPAVFGGWIPLGGNVSVATARRGLPSFSGSGRSPSTVLAATRLGDDHVKGL